MKELTPPTKTTLQALVAHGQGKKMKELQSFIKIETILCQCQVPSLFWGTSDGQQDNTSWSSEDVRFPVGWDQISAAVFPRHGSGVWIIQSSFKVWIPGAQGLDPLHFHHPVVNPVTECYKGMKLWFDPIFSYLFRDFWPFLDRLVLQPVDSSLTGSFSFASSKPTFRKNRQGN